MPKTVRVALLILVLTCTAQAGYIPNETSKPTTPAVHAPEEAGEPPPTPIDPSEEPSGEAQGLLTASLTEIALSLLSVAPSLF